MRIVLCYPAEPHHLDEIARAAPQEDVVDAGQERIAAELLEADIFCGHAKVPLPWDQVFAEGRLQWIQSSAAGVDHCLVPEVVASDVPVTSCSGVLADQVAEQTLALTLGLLRGLPTFFRAKQAREFIRHPTGDLHGARIGIVGLGGNGRRLVEVLHPFQTKIWATDLFPINKPPPVECLLPADGLNEMLAEVEILILCPSLNDTTLGMIGADQLARLPRGALVINVARGQVIVEDDLVAALKSGHLGGAGLDVTTEEPLPPGSELWRLPNVIITPHVGGQSARRYDKVTTFFCENLRRFFAGEPLLNVIDKQLGCPVPHA